MSRAIRERWPIPQALRRPLIERLANVVQDPAASPREVVSAARAVLAASKINLEGIAATIKAREFEESGKEIEELRQQIEELRNRKSSDEPRILIPKRDDRWDRPPGNSKAV